MHVIFSFEQKLSLVTGREEENVIVVGRDKVFCCCCCCREIWVVHFVCSRMQGNEKKTFVCVCWLLMFSFLVLSTSSKSLCFCGSISYTTDRRKSLKLSNTARALTGMPKLNW